MDERALEHIAKKVEGSLKQTQIKDSWPDFNSLQAHVDTLATEVEKHRGKWLTNADVYAIYYDQVTDAITTKAGHEKVSGNLWDWLGEEAARKLKSDLIDFFVSIPRPYDIYLPLPVEMPEALSLEFNDNFAVVVFAKAEDVPGGYTEGLLGAFHELKTKRTYLRYRIDGYCSLSLQNRTLTNALSNFKIAVQQALANDLLIVGESKRAGGLLSGLTHYEIPKAKLVSVDKQSGYVASTELPIGVSKLLHSLEFNTSKDHVKDAIENSELPTLFRSYLRRPAALMVHEDAEAERIKSAIQWCFDSYAMENETLSFLQVCIGLEALFGDGLGRNDPITKTLADRCAYVVAGDIKGRKKIRKNFEGLYDVRSKLVHGVSPALNPDEAYLLRWGRSVLEYSIFKEIKHLGLGQ